MVALSFSATKGGSLNLNGEMFVSVRYGNFLRKSIACDWNAFVERLGGEVMETWLRRSQMFFALVKHQSSSKKIINSVNYDAYMAELLLLTLLFRLFGRAC